MFASKRRDHSALRGSRQRFSHRPVFHHPGLQPLADYLQYPSIRDPLSHQYHQLLLIDTVEVALDVCIHHEVLPLVARYTDRFQGLRRTPLRTKSKTAFFDYRALRRLPGQVLHLLEERVFQDAPWPQYITIVGRASTPGAQPSAWVCGKHALLVLQSGRCAGAGTP
jgi:hypothetical protein